MRKVYVKVIAEFNLEGNITPLWILWEDGRKFPIERVLDVRRAASLKAGGAGLRYTCRIQGKEVYLFYEEPAWFMEGK